MDYLTYINPIQDGHFRTAQGWGGVKKAPPA